MKIGILADSHDNVPALKKAVNYFNELEVSWVIHAGDLIAPFVSKPLSQLNSDFVAVFGNHDGEKFGLEKALSGKIHRAPYTFTYKEKSILILHEPDNLEILVSAGKFDAIIYGHTHQPDIQSGKTLIINPGECGGWLYGRRTIAFWDTENQDARIITI
jgi:uncharacterized protein